MMFAAKPKALTDPWAQQFPPLLAGTNMPPPGVGADPRQARQMSGMEYNPNLSAAPAQGGAPAGLSVDPMAAPASPMQMPGLTSNPLLDAAANQPPAGPKSPFDNMSPWKAALGGLADFLAQQGGGQARFVPAMIAHQQQQAAQAASQQEYQQRRTDTQADWMEQQRWKLEHPEPQFFTSGNDRISYDPATKQSSVIYDGPSDAQDYAASLGYEPGSTEHSRAMQDFVLRGYGPTAMGGKVGLEGVRQENRVQLRGVPTYAATHPRPTGGGQRAGTFAAPRTTGNVIAPIMAKVAAGKPLSAGEQDLFNLYRGRRGGGGPGSAKPGAYDYRAPGTRVTPGGDAPRVPGTRETPAVVTSIEQARALPPGTYFRTPEGKVKVR